MTMEKKRCAACHSPARTIRPGCRTCDVCLEKRREKEREHRKERRRLGLCFWCDRPALPRRCRCEFHLAGVRGEYARKRAAGLCGQHGCTEKTRDGKSYCPEHLAVKYGQTKRWKQEHRDGVRAQNRRRDEKLRRAKKGQATGQGVTTESATPARAIVPASAVPPGAR